MHHASSCQAFIAASSALGTRQFLNLHVSFFFGLHPLAVVVCICTVGNIQCWRCTFKIQNLFTRPKNKKIVQETRLEKFKTRLRISSSTTYTFQKWNEETECVMTPKVLSACIQNSIETDFLGNIIYTKYKFKDRRICICSWCLFLVAY